MKTTSAPTVNNITFVFSVSSADTIKLSTTDGKTKYFGAGGELVTIDNPTYTELFGTATVAVEKIVLTSEWAAASTPEEKAAVSPITGSNLIPYAGTYEFKLSVGGRARMSTTLPEDNASVAMATSDINFTVTIASANGAVDVADLATGTGDKVYFALTGDDSDNTASEAGTITVNKR